MGKRDFMHCTPKDIDLFIEQYDKRVANEAESVYERMKYSAWLNGVYIRLAVHSVLNKHGKYPKEPFGTKDSNNEYITAREDMSDEEKEQLTLTFFNNLQEMQDDFNKHKQEVDGSA